jgi:hypothetical protein
MGVTLHIIYVVNMPLKTMHLLWMEYIKGTTFKESAVSREVSVSLFIEACTTERPSDPFKAWIFTNLHCNLVNEGCILPYLQFRDLASYHHFLLTWG